MYHPVEGAQILLRNNYSVNYEAGRLTSVSEEEMTDGMEYANCTNLGYLARTESIRTA